MLRNKIGNQEFKRRAYSVERIGRDKLNTIRYTLYAKTFCSLLFALCSLLFALSCFAQEEFIYDSKGKRNPFIPLVTSDGRLLKLDKEEGKASLLIEGVIYGEHGLSYAIVNGTVVKIGDKIGDYQVLKIEKKRIVFIKEGQPLEIELAKEEEK